MSKQDDHLDRLEQAAYDAIRWRTGEDHFPISAERRSAIIDGALSGANAAPSLEEGVVRVLAFDTGDEDHLDTPELERRRIIDGAVREAGPDRIRHRDTLEEEQQRATSPVRRARWAASIAVAASVAALGWWGYRWGLEPSPPRQAPPAIARHHDEPRVDVEDEPTLPEPSSLAAEGAMTAHQGRTVIDFAPGVRISLARDASIRWSVTDTVDIDLIAGRLAGWVDRRQFPPHLQVRTGRDRIDIVGTVFEVTPTRLVVLRGKVKVSRGKRQTAVRDGQSAALGHELPPARVAAPGALRRLTQVLEHMRSFESRAPLVVTPLPDGEMASRESAEQGEPRARRERRPRSARGRTARRAAADVDDASSRRAPAELLGDARKLLSTGSTRAAAALYRQLLEEHPESAEAIVARVALGQLLLELGRPRAAGGLCQEYLTRTPNGDLAQEAMLCRIEAARQRGKAELELSLAQQFIQRYPRAVATQELRARIQVLQEPSP